MILQAVAVLLSIHGYDLRDNHPTPTPTQLQISDVTCPKDNGFEIGASRSRHEPLTVVGSFAIALRNTKQPPIGWYYTTQAGSVAVELNYRADQRTIAFFHFPHNFFRYNLGDKRWFSGAIFLTDPSLPTWLTLERCTRTSYLDW
jgi:hypothetical protein